MDEYVCFNGKILRTKEVKISPFNRGMMYGDGCFETIKSYACRFLEFDVHYQRLKDSFKYLNIELTLTKNNIHEQILAVIVANKLENELALIRIQCWRKGGRGYKTESRNFEWTITATSTKNYIEDSVRLITAQTPVIPSNALNRSIKLSNGINYIIAANEAVQKDADDALMLTMNGIISETTISNIFWGKGNIIFTPSIECDLLPGITRNLILEILINSDYELNAGDFASQEICNADFAFTTNSISEIRGVESLDGHHFDANHPEILRIKSMFEALKNERLK